jgi:hypothetical protein
MAWHLENILTCWNFQTSTSKFTMIQVPNGNLFNIRVLPLDLTFPKSLNSFILDKVWGVCAWLEQGCISWQESCFKHPNIFALHCNLHSDFISFDFGSNWDASWACTFPCTRVIHIAKFGSNFKCANNTYHLL